MEVFLHEIDDSINLRDFPINSAHPLIYIPIKRELSFNPSTVPDFCPQQCAVYKLSGFAGSTPIYRELGFTDCLLVVI